MKTNTIHLMGIDATCLSSEKRHILQSCSCLFGAERLQAMIGPVLATLPALKIWPISPLPEALLQMEKALTVSDIAVLASGDPLFFGIGRVLCRRFGADNIRIYPAVSSMQMAFSRFKIPWDDAHFISVHGRSMDDVVSQILASSKVCILTDATNSPASLASLLLEDLGEEESRKYTVHLAENLDQEDERLTTADLRAIAERTCGGLNIMIITRMEAGPGQPLPRFGLQEPEIRHSRGLITKNEVRAATLHALRFPESGVFWDVGAGSGSISIEAARMFPLLKVLAVEADDEQRDNILANKRMLSIGNIAVIHGRAPEALIGLPAPERIFVGGSGGVLQAILKDCTERLKAGGIIVVNGVIEKTRSQAPEILHRMGLHVSMTTVSVRRCSYPENRSVEMNPITIITGCKPL
ncbi:MAG: precorrin-6y C5,15-methyltransferase (decarboxylating) subunit CbiE [Desulfocapsaceae bacterium]|nr:precorrin-6y C5,15-methyltransferase (decarboxylating) subunit CbiE [Desulfocapsaceae bacterium]